MFPLGINFGVVSDVNGRSVAIFRGAVLSRGESGATANNDDSDESGGDGETDVFGLRCEIRLSSRGLLGGETGGEPDGEPDGGNLSGGNEGFNDAN